MSHGSFLRAEREYFSDKLREQGTKECEYHEGLPDWPDCPECQGAYEAYMENVMDADREER